MERINPQAPDFTDRNLLLEQLRAAVPEAFSEGKLDLDLLQELLADDLPDDEARRETFGLNWTGKTNARRIAMRPPKGSALAPCPGEGINEDNTENIFIEGDNLEVLKLLRNAYAGRIKMIYIDPPYNTGNDFIYKDDFSEGIEDYLRKSGQKDGETLLVANPKTSGRFHSNWLNFMYPRLRVAKDLLREDGVIFVSIDDNEVHNLRAVMNEIFGEENLLGVICWKNKYGAGAKTRGFIEVHEYILCYSRAQISNIESPMDEEGQKKFNKKDDKYSKRGGYITQPLATTSLGDRPNLVYPIPWNGKEIFPDKQWVWSKERTFKALENDELVINEKEGKHSVRYKVYLYNEDGTMRKGKPISILNGPFNQEGTDDIFNLFEKPVFSFPKPVELIKYLFSFTINEKEENDGYYMDFFAGSGTMAEAVLRLNNEDGGKRKFICVQLPIEINEKDESGKIAKELGFNNLAQISEERIKRAIQKTNKESGFVIFRLSPSTFRPWRDYTGGDVAQLKLAFEEQARNPLADGWQPAQLLTELLLLEGFPLHSRQEPYAGVTTNRITCVASDFRAHRLFICLDEKIHDDTVEGLQTGKDDVFICFDNALSDLQKFKLDDRLKLKTI